MQEFKDALNNRGMLVVAPDGMALNGADGSETDLDFWWDGQHDWKETHTLHYSDTLTGERCDGNAIYTIAPIT